MKYRAKKMWNGQGWTYYKRWENFTRTERKKYFEEREEILPDLEGIVHRPPEPDPRQIVATRIPQKRAR